MEPLAKTSVRALAGFGIWLTLASCGKTDKPGMSGPGTGAVASAAGAPVSGEAGAAWQSGGAGGTSGSTDAGGESQAAGASDGGANGACVEGAACQCDDLTGTLHCADSPAGECSCPPADICQGTSRSCFEPCGGDPHGVWVLEQTCFNASAEGVDCAGTFIDAVSNADDLRLEILANEPIVAKGSEDLNVTARVPLSCLGIESVARCSEATFYASPLLYGLSRSLACQASECGHCECTGQVESHVGNGYSGHGKPWEPGSSTLAFGAMEVPYCVDGDTLWAGGASADAGPKVAYRFRRRSCVGTPTPCAQRQDGECGTSGDCSPGRCLAAAGGDADICAELAYDQDQCVQTSGCSWDPGGCWGTASELCDLRNCDDTPGCSWGAPQARCGGQVASCFTRSLASCSDTPGCSPRTCYHEWKDDSAACERLTTSAECGKAPGCTWSGTACAGVTHCGVQTDPDVCSTLDCFTSPVPICAGYPTELCSDFTVDDCRDEPGCRLEW